jgi:release factor glutamine methyltransferase
MTARVTVLEAQRRAARALAAAGIDEPAVDARRLVAAALRVPVAVLIRDSDAEVPTDAAARLAAMLARRVAREPVSRILGAREFYGRPFVLAPAVLDPRPDTETLIEAALAVCRNEGWLTSPIRIVDLGTGSGAILLTLLAELPHATGLGIDVSGAALACAKANADALGVLPRCRFEQQDLAAADLTAFDLIVSNPPYIPSAGIETLDPEVARFDPRLALDGGEDGLSLYRAILSNLACRRGVAEKPAWLVLELGADQCDQVIEIAKNTGLVRAPDDVLRFADLNGHIRCIAFKTHPAQPQQKNLETP